MTLGSSMLIFQGVWIDHDVIHILKSCEDFDVSGCYLRNWKTWVCAILWDIWQKIYKEAKACCFFFLCQGVEACKYAVFGNRLRLIFQQLPREFRDFWDLVHLSIAFVGTCVTALLYYDKTSVSLWKYDTITEISRALPPPAQVKHPTLQQRISQLPVLYLLRHLLPRCACQGWAVKTVESGWIPTGLNREILIGSMGMEYLPTWKP